MSVRTLVDNLAVKRVCGARNRGGEPCQCKKLYRGNKCRFHGGLSTGPKTPEGRLRALSNLRYWTPEAAERKANRSQLERQIANPVLFIGESTGEEEAHDARPRLRARA